MGCMALPPASTSPPGIVPDLAGWVRLVGGRVGCMALSLAPSFLPGVVSGLAGWVWLVGC
ncbi:hypothetical protein BJP25_22470 [Actinokineospora bangkokensis]|uniref:Uncharacterized protein n=1 Tax=Actinokineospora bangkokensis TaxID=1193682 RepID=A0A1Q9LJ87_9PSEU|nr:hypothetical protein BJP25_22470 [Actinokineospora bangkokensis]